MSKKLYYAVPECSKFTGYKPCAPFMLCNKCNAPSPVKERILLVSLEAQGAVLMSTSLLHAIKKQYPESHLIWLTRAETLPLLENNHLIDEALPWNEENRLFLGRLEFDIAICLDKSRYAGAFINTVKAKKKYGFGLSPHGAIIPLNRGAVYNYELGINDALKFRENGLTVVEILHKTVELPYHGGKYVLALSPDEIQYRDKWAAEAGLSGSRAVIGFNTGCSGLFPNKKLSVDQHVTLIKMLHDHGPDIKIILLGGREDTERNALIHEKCGKLTVKTPTTEGLRRGIIYEDLADIVVSGDSLGMHIAIGIGKYVVAWFGLSCAPEIDLFGRGEKIVSGLSCSPCWKKSCEDPRCLEEMSLRAIYEAVIRGVNILRTEKAGLK